MVLHVGRVRNVSFRPGQEAPLFRRSLCHKVTILSRVLNQRGLNGILALKVALPMRIRNGSGLRM